MDTLNSEKDLSVTETNNNEILGKAQVKDSNMYQTREGQQIKETRETTRDATQSVETNNIDKPTPPPINHPN